MEYVRGGADCPRQRSSRGGKLTARVRRIGLTGGIATGKSAVRAELERAGVPTIDADLLARAAVAPGTEGLVSVVARFGRGVLDGAGELDRKRLGALVFADEDARRALEQIVHPFVRRAVDAWFTALDGGRHTFAVADIPLLFETGRAAEFDAVVVAACDPATQLQRVMARDGLTEEEALLRIRAQWPLEEKVKRADYVVRTDGSFEQTRAAVRALIPALAMQNRRRGDDN